MLMPSLPPALKPSMIRPRAGQRNSGVEPDASASSAVTGALAPAALGSTLPVGVASIPGFLAAADGLAGSALATTEVSVLTSAAFPAGFDASAVFASFFFSATLSSDLDSDLASAFAFLAFGSASFAATSSARFLAGFSVASATVLAAGADATA